MIILGHLLQIFYGYFAVIFDNSDNCGGNGGFSKRTNWHNLAATIRAVIFIKWVIINYEHHHQLIF